MAIHESLDGAVSFLNPAATNYAASTARAGAAVEAFAIPEEHRHVIEDRATPQHVQQTVQGRTLVYGGGGDSTANLVAASILGDVQDNPEATANNRRRHAELATYVRYLPGPDGNANNFALSALGRLARYPSKLAAAPESRVGLHRPLLYEVRGDGGDGGDTVRSGIVTSCFGLGCAALAARDLDKVKPELKQLPRPVRLGREALIAFGAVVDAPAFSIASTLTIGGETQTRDFSRITGIESIGSAIYAKEGRTRVNIDDTREQLVVTEGRDSRFRQQVATIATLGRVKTGRHALPAIDITDRTEFSLRLTSDQPVPFHVDGEIGVRYQLEPGQTVYLRRSDIAIPTLMAR